MRPDRRVAWSNYLDKTEGDPHVQPWWRRLLRWYAKKRLGL